MLTLGLLSLLATMILPEPPQGLAGTSDTTVRQIPFDPKRWKLDWSDEFSGGTSPDPRFWSYEEGYLRNNEAQFYTKGRRDNARIENGRLSQRIQVASKQGLDIIRSRLKVS